MVSAPFVLMKALTLTAMVVLLNASTLPLVKFKVLLLVNQVSVIALLALKLVTIGFSLLNLVSLPPALIVILSLSVLVLLKVALTSALLLLVLLAEPHPAGTDQVIFPGIELHHIC